jgi:hypothetical protein
MQRRQVYISSVRFVHHLVSSSSIIDNATADETTTDLET